MKYKYEVTDSAYFSQFDDMEYRNTVARSWLTDESGYKYPIDNGVDLKDATPPDYIHNYKVTVLVETNAEELTSGIMRNILRLVCDKLLCKYRDGIPHIMR